jgi:hypothetical protein
MKSIIFLITIFLFSSCNFQENNQNNYTKGDTSEEIPTQENNHEILELPILGTFSLSNMKIDSLHEYGAGDCWGTVTKYSLKDIGLAIDTMSCGEYGYTYTYYFLNDKGSILTVFQKKSELSLQHGIATIAGSLLVSPLCAPRQSLSRWEVTQARKSATVAIPGPLCGSLKDDTTEN